MHALSRTRRSTVRVFSGTGHQLLAYHTQHQKACRLSSVDHRARTPALAPGLRSARSEIPNSIALAKPARHHPCTSYRRPTCSAPAPTQSTQHTQGAAQPRVISPRLHIHSLFAARLASLEATRSSSEQLKSPRLSPQLVTPQPSAAPHWHTLHASSRLGSPASPQIGSTMPLQSYGMLSTL